MNDSTEEFGLTLAGISRAWRTKLDERLRVFGLSQAKWATLLHLSHYPDGLIQKELAERIGIEGPTLVRLLDRLEIDGLVIRCASASDRRIRIIRLTTKAEPLLGKIQQIAGNLRHEILGDVAVSELNACINLMKGIRKRIDSLG
ncbi:MAG TPA: MarR family transcriptional regulator [Burkholderiales bacterium]|nr:MarR family transcriptional regulator [Burkholderiales bacterium]